MTATDEGPSTPAPADQYTIVACATLDLDPGPAVRRDVSRRTGTACRSATPTKRFTQKPAARCSRAATGLRRTTTTKSAFRSRSSTTGSSPAPTRWPVSARPQARLWSGVGGNRAGPRHAGHRAAGLRRIDGPARGRHRRHLLRLLLDRPTVAARPASGLLRHVDDPGRAGRHGRRRPERCTGGCCWRGVGAGCGFLTKGPLGVVAAGDGRRRRSGWLERRRLDAADRGPVVAACSDRGDRRPAVVL